MKTCKGLDRWNICSSVIFNNGNIGLTKLTIACKSFWGQGRMVMLWVINRDGPSKIFPNCIGFPRTVRALSPSLTSPMLNASPLFLIRSSPYYISSRSFWDHHFCLSYSPLFWPHGILDKLHLFTSSISALKDTYDFSLEGGRSCICSSWLIRSNVGDRSGEYPWW